MPKRDGIGTQDHPFMSQALKLAQQAEIQDEVPVGAVVVLDGEIIGRGYNQPITMHDPSAHAEILALRDAAAHQQNYRLPESTLYVTLEPCIMCYGAMLQARVQKIVYGAFDPKVGVFSCQKTFLNQDRFNHTVNAVGGVLEKECREQLQHFFKVKRTSR